MRVSVLLVLCVVSTFAEAALKPSEVPAFAIRCRLAELEGQPVPPERPTRFYLSGISTGVVATGDAWSPDLLCGEKAFADILKLYPNLYLKGYPVVLHLLVRPAGKTARVEVQVRWQPAMATNEPDVALSARLTGEKLGLLLWREEDHPRLATMAAYNRRYWEALGDTALTPERRPRHFPIVDRFIGGDNDPDAWREGIENLARAGFSALMLPATPDQRERLLATGLRRTAGAVYSPPGHVFDHDPKITQESLEAWARDQAAPFLKAGYTGADIALYALSDEPGWYFPSRFKAMVENPIVLKRFHEYLAGQGLTPADVGSADWESVRPLGRSQAETLTQRRLFYWTTRFFAYDSARYFARATRALENAFGASVPIYVNWNFFSGRHWFPGPFGNNPDKSSPDSAMGSHDWFEFARLRGCSMLWTEDWFGDNRAWQWSFYASKLNSAARLGGIEFGGYVIPRTAGQRPGGMIQKILTLVGHGGKALKYFVFGPEYNFPGNCYSAKSRLLPEMARAHAMIAAAEPVLWPGRRPAAPAAILQPRSALVWDPCDPKQPIVDATNTNPDRNTTDYMAEIFGLYLGLQHANQPIDWVDEDALTPEGLAPLKTLYITAPAIPAEAFAPLLAWVEAGGTLAATSAALTRDRYNQPDPSFWKRAGLDVLPREVMLCPNAANLPKVAETDVYTAVGVADEPAAGVREIRLGKGRILYYGWLPGCSYWASQGQAVNGLPAGFNAAIRDRILEPIRASGIEPPVRASLPLVETPMLLSDAGAAITLLNWRGEPVDALQLDIRLPFKAQSAETVGVGPVAMETLPDGRVRVVLPVDLADILLIRP
jgi:hypothetical protein